MAKYKKTNDVTGASRKTNAHDSSYESMTHEVNRKTGTENVKTSSQTHKSATERTHESTRSYSENKFVESSSSVQDSSAKHVGTSSHKNPSFSSSNSSAGRVPTSVKMSSLKNALGSMNYEVNRETGTGHVQTALQSQMASAMRTYISTEMSAMSTYISTEMFHSNHIQSDYKSGLTAKMKRYDPVIEAHNNGNFQAIAPKVTLSKKELDVFSKYAKDSGLSYYVLKKGDNADIFVSAGQINNLKTVRANIVADNNAAYLLDKVNKLEKGAISALGEVSKLSSRSDLGTASVGGVAKAGELGLRGFGAVQTATEVGIKAGTATIKGAVNVGDFAVKGAKSLDSFMGIARVTPLSDNAFQVLKSQALANKLEQTKIAKGLIHSADNVKKTLNHGFQGAQTLIRKSIKTGNSIIHAGKITRNVFAGTYSGKQIVHGIGLGAGKVAKGAGNVGLKGIKTVGKGVRWTFVKALPKTAKILGKGAAGAWRFGAKALLSSQDMGLQAVGATAEASYHAVKAAKATVKTAQAAGKTIVYAGKGAYRATTGVVRGFRFIKNNGLKAAWNHTRKRLGKKLVSGVKQGINNLLQLVRRLGFKLLVPIIIIALIVSGFSIITTPIMAAASVFGGVFNNGDDGKEVNIDDYLKDPTKGVPAKTTALKNKILDMMIAAEAHYHIVRFRANTDEEAGKLVIEHTFEAISSVFPTDEEIIEMVKPLFQAVILMQYDNSPTDAQCQALLDHIIDTMFVIDEKDTLEYCGQDLITGEGEVDYCAYCGDVHAHDDCPNKLPIAYHSSFKCDLCCYLYCPGHEAVDEDDEPILDEDGDPVITYCDGCEHACNGHIDCGGHKVKTFILTCDGIYELVQEYFLDPIDVLENTDPRTDEEEKKLRKLKDYYELFEEIAKLVGIGGFSGGLSLSDLEGVKWVHGSRKGCQELVTYALQFRGNIGGKPFWSYLGFEKRVAWCACFVKYIMDNSGYGGSYPSSTNYAGAHAMMSAFDNVSRFQGSSFTDLVAGDVIYFDWGHDGHVDHTGIVIGRDATKVYTVEGNSGDVVKIKAYNLTSSVIYGYGLMEY